MTIEEMKQRKKELGYTCARLSELSGVPLSTVQKIFSGATPSPRYGTLLSLESLLANAASLFVHQAEQKALEFILDIPPDLPPQVLGDPLRLTQVLSNLLSNALKFTSEGSVTLSARSERTSAQMCRVRFSIADSGIGMNGARESASLPCSGSSHGGSFIRAASR